MKYKIVITLLLYTITFVNLGWAGETDVLLPAGNNSNTGTLNDGSYLERVGDLTETKTLNTSSTDKDPFSGGIRLNNGKTILGKIVDADTYVVTVRKEVPFLFLKLWQDSQIPRKEIDYVKGKNPNTAFALALFPGIFLHGFGHSYAEDEFFSTLLSGAEGVSIPFMIFSMFGGQYGYGLFITGMALFWGSWIFDFIHAPASAEHYNERILREFKLPLKISMQPSRSEYKIDICAIKF